MYLLKIFRFYIHKFTDEDNKLYNMLRIPTSIFNSQTQYIIRDTNLNKKSIEELKQAILDSINVINQIDNFSKKKQVLGTIATPITQRIANVYIYNNRV